MGLAVMSVVIVVIVLPSSLFVIRFIKDVLNAKVRQIVKLTLIT